MLHHRLSAMAFAPLLRYADVVVETPTGKHGDTFTYSVPDHMDLAPGHLVRVPFATRRLRGVVVGPP